MAAATVALAALFRLPRLAVTPGWDGDEGYNIQIAWQLLHGRAQAFSLSYAFVQHPVLFYALLAPLLQAFGRELWVARMVTATAGALVTGTVYLAATVACGRRLAVLSALAFACSPFIIAYNRLAYTYNLLLLWSALALFLVLYGDRTGRHWAFWAAATAGALALLTDQEGVFLPLFVAGCAWPNRRRAGLALGMGLLPAVTAAAMALAWQPEAALADWRHTLWRTVALPEAATTGRSGPGALITSLATALARWVINYLHLLRAEWWWPAAVAGLFALRPIAVRRRLLGLTALMLMPVLALRELEPFFRTAIPLLLPAAWGLGALLHAGIDAVYETLGAGSGRQDHARQVRALWPPRLAAAALVALAVVLPLGLEAGRAAGALVLPGGYTTRIDWALAFEHDAARVAAAFVNDRTQPQDAVLVSPHVSWLYQAQVTDFFQAIAWRGEAVAFYPAGMPPTRFVFSASLEHVRYAVLDGYMDRWATESGQVARLQNELSAWPLELRAGPYRVHRRPVEGSAGLSRASAVADDIRDGCSRSDA